MARTAIVSRATIPSLQNLLLRSQEFDNASWTKTNVTAVPDNTTAPDGTTTAEFIRETLAAGAAHQVDQTPAGSFGFGTMTLSVFAQAASRVWLLCAGSGGAKAGWVNVSTSTVGTVNSGADLTIDAASNWIAGADSAWKRIKFTFPVQDNGTPYFCYFRLATGNAVAVYDGDGASGMYLWGAQLAQCNRLSLYQATTSSQVNTGPLRWTP